MNVVQLDLWVAPKLYPSGKNLPIHFLNLKINTTKTISKDIFLKTITNFIYIIFVLKCCLSKNINKIIFNNN